ncbi:2-C-methyl-D-erythritol 2,4-cyclodiphosphate synthase, partial [Candidatus Hakubella thermalkaliphila]
FPLEIIRKAHEMARADGFLGTDDGSLVERVGYHEQEVEMPRVGFGHQLGIMQENIASTLQIDLEKVNVKACTSEGLGFTGRSEGAVAYAVAMVEKQDSKS